MPGKKAIAADVELAGDEVIVPMDALAGILAQQVSQPQAQSAEQSIALLNVSAILALIGIGKREASSDEGQHQEGDVT